MPPRANAAAVERPRLRTTKRTESIFITQLPIMTEWRVYLSDVGQDASAIPLINSFGARQRGESFGTDAARANSVRASALTTKFREGCCTGADEPRRPLGRNQFHRRRRE